MTLPSNAEVVAALRQLFSSSPVMLAGSPEAVAEDVLRIVRLAATQEQRGEADDRRVEAAAKAYITARCEQGHGIDYSIRRALQAANAVTSSKSDAPAGKDQ